MESQNLSQESQPPQAQPPQADTRDSLSIRSLTVRGGVIAGAAGGIVYGVNFGLQALVVALNFTGATGLISGFTVPFALALASRINRQFGTATLAWSLYSLLAIPTLLMGSPGAYKLIVGILGGLAYDVGFCGTRGRKLSTYIALVAYVFMLAISFYVVYVAGLMTDIQGGSILKILLVISAVFLVEGLLSTWIADRYYKKYVSKVI